MLLALVARRRTATNVALADAAPPWVDARVLTPEEAVTLLGGNDVAVGRLDVTESLDGVEDGLWALGTLAARGVRVLNRAGALLAAHDKLLTARVLEREGLPHPRTRMLHADGPPPAWAGPVVVKPRFGSWGRDVVMCKTELDFRRHLHVLERVPWFQRHGALVQEFVEPAGHDLRVVVAGGVPVGAISRVAARGEWRTNVSLGGTRVRVDPAPAALALAGWAAAAARTELAGRPASRRGRRVDRPRAERRGRLFGRVPNRPRSVRRGGERARPIRAGERAGGGVAVFTTSSSDLHLLSAHASPPRADTPADIVNTNNRGEK